jgi:chaperonin GroEL (HSP60 family)
MAKQLHFNKDGSALKKMQAGVDKLASVVGITLGPKVAYVIEYCQHGHPIMPKPAARFCQQWLHGVGHHLCMALLW